MDFLDRMRIKGVMYIFTVPLFWLFVAVIFLTGFLIYSAHHNKQSVKVTVVHQKQKPTYASNHYEVSENVMCWDTAATDKNNGWFPCTILARNVDFTQYFVKITEDNNLIVYRHLTPNNLAATNTVYLGTFNQ